MRLSLLRASRGVFIVRVRRVCANVPLECLYSIDLTRESQRKTFGSCARLRLQLQLLYCTTVDYCLCCLHPTRGVGGSSLSLRRDREGAATATRHSRSVCALSRPLIVLLSPGPLPLARPFRVIFLMAFWMAAGV